MRIIRGKYAKRRFALPPNFKARPTTDMAKESLFNILENRIEWENTTVLDMFAGTGGIGLEMLSRGAKSVLAFELNFSQVSFIKKVLASLGAMNYKIIRMDALRWLTEQATLPSNKRDKYDLIFSDPPYSLPELPQLPDMILESGILTDDGLLIVEHPKGISFADHPLFREVRNYGAVHFSFFSYIE